MREIKFAINFSLLSILKNTYSNLQHCLILKLFLQYKVFKKKQATICNACNIPMLIVNTDCSIYCGQCSIT